MGGADSEGEGRRGTAGFPASQGVDRGKRKQKRKGRIDKKVEKWKRGRKIKIRNIRRQISNRSGKKILFWNVAGIGSKDKEFWKYV